MKATPGPWHTDKGKSFYVFASGALAEQAGVENGPFVCNASTEANARLIAASPCILRELKHLVAIIDPWIEVGMSIPGLATLNAAKAAIAKAEGEV